MPNVSPFSTLLARLLGLNYVATTRIAGYYVLLSAHGRLKELSEHGQFAHASMLTLLRDTGNGAVVLSNLERAVIQLFPFGHVACLGHYFGHFGHASPQSLARHARGVSGHRRFFHVLEDAGQFGLSIQLSNGADEVARQRPVLLREKGIRAGT